MTEGVIDVFETIEVEEKYGNSFFVAYERGAKSAYEEIHLTQVMLYV